MLALAPALLVLAAANVRASPEAEALVARQSYGACEPKCTTFDTYYSACTSDAKGETCLAVCTPTEWVTYQGCLNCIEEDQGGVSFKSTLEKVQQRCIDNGRGDPTNGAGITSKAASNSTGHGGASSSSNATASNPHATSNETSKNATNPHAGLASTSAVGSGSAAAPSSTGAPSAASAVAGLSVAGIVASVVAGVAMLV